MDRKVTRNLQSISTVLPIMSDYKFHNRNPDQSRINDCVTRAISEATGLSYTATGRLLAISAQMLDCDKLSVCCYKHLLTHVLGYKSYKCRRKISVDEVINDFPNDIILIRLDGHLTCAKYGVLLDTWDCYDRDVDRFWIVS